MLKRVIELVGPKGCGKSSILQQLVKHCLLDGSVLIIDASPDLQLSHQYLPEPLNMQLLGPSLEKLPGTVSFINEAQDHLLADQFFTDLAATTAENLDLLSVGPLPKNLSGSAKTVLQYGFPRLLRQYTYILIDGYHEVIHSYLPTESYFPLIVVSPVFAAAVPKLSVFQFTRKTPSLILNCWEEEPIPEALETFIQEEKVYFAGKIPAFKEDSSMPTEAFERACENCMMRLDIPWKI